MNITVFGLGKLGSPLAAWIASAGHHVFGVDPDYKITDMLSRHEAPISEPGLQQLLDAHHARIEVASDAKHAVSQSEFVFIIVPTPTDETGCFSSRFLEMTLDPIAAAIRDGAHPVVVVVSTTTPGTMTETIIPALQAKSGCCCGVDFDMCYNPEFIALGSVLHDMSHPSFILIGESTRKAGDALEAFYRHMHMTLDNPIPPFARMSMIDAEICKLSVNCFVTTKISYANQLAALCERIPGADAKCICSVIGLDRRIGQPYLNPATCYGGPCFPRDNRALLSYAKRIGVPMPIATATDQVNNQTTERLGKLLTANHPRTVAILGLTYKPYTPVTEESQSVKLLDWLSQMDNLVVFTHDPFAKYNHPLAVPLATAKDAVQRADAVLIATAWPEYRNLSPDWFSASTTIVDCWGLIDQQAFRNHRVVTLGKGQITK